MGVPVWHIVKQSDDAFDQHQRNGGANSKNSQGKDGNPDTGAVKLGLGIGVSVHHDLRFHRRYGPLAPG